MWAGWPGSQSSEDAAVDAEPTKFENHGEGRGLSGFSPEGASFLPPPCPRAA